MIALRVALALLAVVLAAPHLSQGASVGVAAACDAEWAPVSTPLFRGSDSSLAALDRSGADTWAAVNLARPGTAGTQRSALLATTNGRLATIDTVAGTLHDLDIDGVSGWAVGSRRTSQGYVTTVLRLSAGQWRPAPSVNPGEWENDLRAVATDGSGLAWAAGTSADLGKARRPLLLRLDEGGAHEVATGIVRGELNDVAIDGAAGWAVGSRTVGSLEQGLVFRRDSDTWTAVQFPRFKTGVVLTSVTIGPGGTAWAVGYQPDVVDLLGNTISRGALAFRWDGTSWQRALLARLPRGAMLTSVANDGTTILAVGDAQADGHVVPVSIVLDGAGPGGVLSGSAPGRLASVVPGPQGGFIAGGHIDAQPDVPFGGSSRVFAARLCILAGG